MKVVKVAMTVIEELPPATANMLELRVPSNRAYVLGVPQVSQDEAPP